MKADKVNGTLGARQEHGLGLVAEPRVGFSQATNGASRRQTGQKLGLELPGGYPTGKQAWDSLTGSQA